MQSSHFSFRWWWEWSSVDRPVLGHVEFVLNVLGVDALRERLLLELDGIDVHRQECAPEILPSPQSLAIVGAVFDRSDHGGSSYWIMSESSQAHARTALTNEVMESNSRAARIMRRPSDARRAGARSRP